MYRVTWTDSQGNNYSSHAIDSLEASINWAEDRLGEKVSYQVKKETPYFAERKTFLSKLFSTFDG